MRNMAQERLDKILASQGLGSRKEVGQWIRRGLVQVNGQTVLQRGKKLVDGDVVTYRGESIKIEK